MSHDYTLSETGLDLIKSFEGFRPVDRTLINGQRVVGYGHKVRGEETMIVTRTEAEALLMQDLAPYEDMVNNEVYAPLSQNQFDALVSLAFSVGPKAFQLSPTLHLINNGRPLAAARSFEVWCKSRINGRTYIVDALVRRRAAEKALFLTIKGEPVAAPRNDLKSIEDTRVIGDIMSEDLPVFETENLGIVGQVPYDALQSEKTMALDVPQRRREDGPAGILTLSEVVDDDYIFSDQEGVFELDNLVDDTQMYNKPSPIAMAAAEVSDRLDALIDSAPEREETADWPESLIQVDSAGQPLEALPEILIEAEDEDIIRSELESIQEAYEAETQQTVGIDGTHKAANDYTEFSGMDEQREGGLGPYLVMMVAGLTLIGASLGAMMRGGTTQFGEAMPFWSGVGMVIGAAVLLAAFYYVLKSIFRRS